MTKEQFSPFFAEDVVWAEVVRAELVRRINRLDVSDRRRVAASRDVITTAKLRDDGSVELSVELDDRVTIGLGCLPRRALASMS